MAPQREPHHQRIQAGGHTLCLYQWPDPDARYRLLAMHGFAGDGEDFAPLFRALPGVECMSLDLLGHGRSDAPRSRQPYETHAQLEQLEAVLHHVTSEVGDPRPLFLLGYSMGGRLLLQWASRCDVTQPAFAALRGCVLIGASPGIEDAQERARRRLWDEAWACRAEQMGVASFMRAWRALPIIRTQQRMSAEDARRLARRRLKQRVAGLAGSMRGFGAGAMPPCWPLLRANGQRFTTPVLYLAGEEDEVYTRTGARLSALLSHGQFERVMGSGHAPHLETPAACAAAVRRFMDRLEDRGREEGAG